MSANSEGRALDVAITEAIIGLCDKQPLLGQLIYSCQRVIAPDLGGLAGVNMTSKGMYLFISPQFSQLTSGSSRQVLQHEMLHLLLQHPVRGRYMGGYGSADQQGDRARKNLAMDIVVNELVFGSQDAVVHFCGGGSMQVVSRRVIAGRLKLPMEPDMPVEYYYRILRACEVAESDEFTQTDPCGKNSLAEEDGGVGSGGCGNGVGDSITVSNNSGSASFASDRHQKWQSDLSEADARGLMSDLVKRAQSRLDGRGNMAAGLQLIIDELTKPSCPEYVRLLRHFLARSLSSSQVDEPSYRRPARREVEGYLAPGRLDAKGGMIGIIMDTSGSMSDAAVTQCISLITTTPDIGEIHFMAADTRGYEIIPLSRCDLKGGISSRMARAIRGKGGTEFDAPICKMMEKVHPDVIVYLTDGRAPEPASAVAKAACIIWGVIDSKAPPAWMSSGNWRSVMIPKEETAR